MTALPLEPHTEAEEATLKRIEGAPAAPESWPVRWGLARRLFDVECDGCGCGGWEDPVTDRGVYLEMADAALAFMAQSAAAIEAMPGPSAAEEGREVECERQKITQGFCPRSNQRIMPGGNLRPACSFCDCGEYR